MAPSSGREASWYWRLWIIPIMFFLIHYAEGFPYKNHARYKRQLISMEEPVPMIDLNTTVPYIFAARLYPYGRDKGDLLISNDIEPYKLENPFHYLGQIFDTIYIHRSGAVYLSPGRTRPKPLPVSQPIISVFWMSSEGGKVYYRESTDIDMLNLAHNEVNIQYRYGSKFQVKSVLLITWEDVRSTNNPMAEGNTFQLALIIGDTMTFAHFVYSKLNINHNAVAGFSAFNHTYSLPDSGTSDAITLAEKSDIGIPGEWLMQIDSEQVYLCGYGFKGLECIEACEASQWFNDCSKSCHCDGGDACDQETGRCPSGKCSPGWENEPTCDKDIDECQASVSPCPKEQPDCLNSPGSFLCLCFEFDEQKKTCKGSPQLIGSPSPIPVDVVPMHPSFQSHATTRKHVAKKPQRFSSTTKSTLPPTTTTTTTTPTTTTTTTTASTSTATTTTTELQTSPSASLRQIEVAPSQITFAPPTSITTSVCTNCDRHAICHNRRCVCNEGWQGDGTRCYDVDECTKDPKVCGAHASCVNTEGGYDCVCDGGFMLSNNHCTDIDECSNDEKICGESRGIECVNKVGSFECRCRDGYEGSMETGCSDINECVRPEACGPNARCANTAGGYECECLTGFERLAPEAFCTDIDECAVSPCHHAAICTNIKGSYTCTCPQGFIGDGMECAETILYPISNDSFILPRQWNAWAAINLPTEIKIFGRRYSKAYLSSNGIVSFDMPLSGVVEDPKLVNSSAIFALHSQHDYSREGLVAYTYINESDPTASPLLKRATLGARDVFHIPNFDTTRLHIFTFDGMRQAGSENVNSFQIVLAESRTGETLASLIYEKAGSKGPITGISYPHSFFFLPNDQLSSMSNVAHPGLWMYRIDANLVPCPAGRHETPICNMECASGHWGFDCINDCHCQRGEACDKQNGTCQNGCDAGWQGDSCNDDIDECAANLVQCGLGAVCENKIGSFECKCDRGYLLLNNVCQPVERCVSRYGLPCSEHASCEEKPDGPTCICHAGFEGSGFQCELKRIPNDLASSGRNVLLAPSVPKTDGTIPFNIPNISQWPTTENKPTLATAASMVPPHYTAPPIKPLDTKSSETKNEKNDDAKKLDDESLKEGDKDAQADASTMFFVIAPIVLCSIWFVLVLVVIALCWKHRTQRRRFDTQKQMENIWAQPVTSSHRPSLSIHSFPQNSAPSRIRNFEGY